MSVQKNPVKASRGIQALKWARSLQAIALDDRQAIAPNDHEVTPEEEAAQPCLPAKEHLAGLWKVLGLSLD